MGFSGKPFSFLPPFYGRGTVIRLHLHRYGYTCTVIRLHLHRYGYTCTATATPAPLLLHLHRYGYTCTASHYICTASHWQDRLRCSVCLVIFLRHIYTTEHSTQNTYTGVFYIRTHL